MYVTILDMVSSAVTAVSRDFFRSQLRPERVVFQAGAAPDDAERGGDLAVDDVAEARQDARFAHWFADEDEDEEGEAGVAHRGARPNGSSSSSSDEIAASGRTNNPIELMKRDAVRIAIVVAVDDYESEDTGFPNLACATNDGALMRSILEKLGWTVHATLFNRDCTRSNTEDAFD